MNELIDYGCIDFKKLLILKAKSLTITDQECYVLLLIMTMNDIQMKPINPQTISKISSMSLKKIDQTLLSLLDKHIIDRKHGNLELKPLYQLLLKEKTEKKDVEMDLISMFENAFGRSLNQIELGIIQSFKSQGYDDVMILDALNESVKSGVMNFRYIEKILDNWSKYGVKRRYAPMSSTTKIDDIPQEIKDLKWWEDNE
ncbi:MAG: DnaD domain protein [Erysipelotrichales bacterium]|nr:DnaD domain protein [Erysipelotrichales bacterium]